MALVGRSEGWAVQPARAAPRRPHLPPSVTATPIAPPELHATTEIGTPTTIINANSNPGRYGDRLLAGNIARIIGLDPL